MPKFNKGDAFVKRDKTMLALTHQSPYFLTIAVVKGYDVEPNETIWYEVYNPLNDNYYDDIVEEDLEKNFIPLSELEKALSDEIFDLQNNLYTVRTVASGFYNR